MTHLTDWILTELDVKNNKIKNIVAIYPGRFQPMGAHHAKTYEWLAKKFGKSNTFVATSNKVQLPKSPFNFNEKKKIINSYGITNVVEVKNPYKAEEILSKYDPNTTAAVFMVGAKDAGRLGGNFFRPWKGEASVGYKDGAYLVVAPHVSMNVPGFGEMSGTEIRKALGSDTPNKEKIFKGIFGHTKSNIYNLVVPKLEKLSETITKFVSENNIPNLLSENSDTISLTGSEVDDGPRYFYGHRQAYEVLSKQMAERIGYEVVDWILGETPTMDFRNPYPKGPVRSVSYFPSGVAGKTTPTNQQDYKGTKAYSEWQKHIKRVAGILGMEFVNWLSADDSKNKNVKEPNKVDKTPNIAESLIREVDSNLDKELSYKDENGDTKKITARAALRSGEDHPAYNDALRIKQQIDKDTEQNAERDKQDKKRDTAVDKKDNKQADKADTKQSNLSGDDFALDAEVDFAPDGETPKDTKFAASKKLLSKAKKGLKKLSDSEKQAFREIPNQKRTFGDAIINKAKSIPGALKKTFQHKVHVYKDTAKAFGKLALGDPLHKEDKSALKQFAIDVAILSGMVASGGVAGGAGALGKAVVSNFATMWVKDITVLGVGRAALFAGVENKTEDEYLEQATKHFGEWLKNKKLTPEQYTEILASMGDEPQTPVAETFSKEWWQNIVEEIKLPVEVGDTVYMGKFKNKAVKVKDISWNEKGDLLINGKSALRMRIPNKSNVFGDDPRYTNESLSESFKDDYKGGLESLRNAINKGEGGMSSMDVAKLYYQNALKMGVSKKVIDNPTRLKLNRNNKNFSKLGTPTKQTLLAGIDIVLDSLTEGLLLEGFDYVVCQICKEHKKQISGSHCKTHGITFKEYKSKFPNSPTLPEKTRQKLIENNVMKIPEIAAKNGKSRIGTKRPDVVIKNKTMEHRKKVSDGVKRLYDTGQKEKKTWNNKVKELKTKAELGQITPRHLKSLREQYYTKVDEITERSYQEYFSYIPNATKRNKKFHLDHKISKNYGFLNDIPAEIIGHYRNLEVIPHYLNESKGAKNSFSLNELLRDIKYSYNSVILEGGAAGHMNHPFDDANLKFADIKKMIDLGLQGKLNVEQSVSEKTDGQNLMVTWKDGKLKAARNKTTLKEPMDINVVKKMFAGRGDIEKAFVYAMQDLESAISRLTDKQREKIFKNGRSFMNLEIIYPATENVIVYDTAVLQFHGAIEYDENANIIGPVKDSAKMLQGMIQQVNADVQKHFKIIKPHILDIKPHNDYTKKRDYFFNKLKKLQKEFNLKDQDTLAMYHQLWWESFIRKNSGKYIVPNNVMEGLIRRWAFWEKAYSVRDMKKDIKDPKFLEWVLSFDKKDHKVQVKKNMLPFELLIFEVGSEILHNVENYLTASPDKAVEKIRKEIDTVARDIEKGGDINKIKKLKQQLQKIEALGGLDRLVPSEGLVFVYGGKTYKFTGHFSSVNQILGTLKFER